MKYRKSLLIVISIIALGALLWNNQSRGFDEKREEEKTESFVDNVPVVAREVTVYKEASCGCCMGYIAELEKQGFSVEVKSLQEPDMDSVKKQYAIPQDKQSCHTTIVGGYFVEGHVPLAAVERLLTEKPDIDGIGLPGMPLGTPGMPGAKQAPYEVYQKVDNEFALFMTL